MYRVNKNFFLLIFGLFTLLALQPLLTFAKEITTVNQTVTIDDLYKQTIQIEAELEALRYYMGKPLIKEVPFQINEPQTSDLYFISLSIFEKANNLSFEFTRTLIDYPDVIFKNVQLKDVSDVLSNVLQRIMLIQSQLPIKLEHKPITLLSDVTPETLLNKLLLISRQLDILQDTPTQSTLVYEKLTEAIYLAGTLLDKIPNTTHYPTPQEYEAGKTNADVYQKAQVLYQESAKLLTTKKLPHSQLQFIKTPTIIANDTYDLISIIVANLSDIYSKIKNPQQPFPTIYPGRKFPSDVYQRLSILEQQIQQLNFYAQKNGNTLNPHD